MSDEKSKDLQATMLGTGPGKPATGGTASADEPVAVDLGRTSLGVGASHVPARARPPSAEDLPAPVAVPAGSVVDGPPGGGSTTNATVALRRTSDPERTDHPAASEGGDGRGASFVGRTLRGYKVLQKIAEGGMGEIYLGEHAQLGRRGALKILKPEFCQNEEVVERFTQEARAVNSIRHQNIVEVYDYGRDAGRVFFVMEYLEGEALDRRIARGALPWKEGLTILEQTIRALEAAHAKGFVHRDLKPENIFLRRRDAGDTVKLLDFGIAKLTSGEARDKLTRTGSMIGTPHYMSPEQINGSGDVDLRTDIYSLGVIIYEMFTGKRPFGGDTLAAILKEHLFTPPPRLAPDRSLGVPPGVAQIVDRMLAKEVDDRYSSISDVLADLRDVAQNRSPSWAETLSRQRPLAVGTVAGSAPAAAPVPAGRNWGLLAAGIAAGLAAAAVAVWVARGDGTETPATATQTATGGTASATATATATTATPPATPGVPAAPTVDRDKARADAEGLLRGSLRETEPALRVQASDALGRVKDRPSVPDLLQMAGGDADPEVRGHAAGALGDIGDRSVADQLDDLREKAPPALAVWFDEALWKLGTERARKRLAKAARSRELAVSFKATLALADASAPGDKEAIKALTALAAREAELNDIAPYAGVALMARLMELRHAPARDALISVLTQSDEGARVVAAEALARVGDATGKAMLEKALADEGSANRLVAARALVALGDYSGFDLLTEKLADEDPVARRQAAAGLAEIGDNASLRPLVDALDDKDKSVRIAAAAALLTIIGLDSALLAQTSVDWARSALSSKDWAVRTAAARTIGDIPSDEALPLLAQAIADPEANVRRAAARSARKLKGAQAARQVAQAARVEKDRETKEEQVIALAKIADQEARPVVAEIAAEPGRVGLLASGALLALGDDTTALARLDKAIHERKQELRLAAVESAALASNASAVPVLETGVKDSAFIVRFFSAEGLSGYGASADAAVPVLNEALADRNPDIQARAQAALLRFGVTPSGGPSPSQMLDSPDAATRLAAIAAIAALPGAQALALLRRAVTDADLEVRRAAVDAVVGLSKDQPEEVKKILKSLVQDGDPITRTKAQAQLAKLVEPPPAAAPAPAATPAAGGDPAPALVQAQAARTELETALSELSQLTADVEKRTSAKIDDDDQVEQVVELAKRLDSAERRVKKAREALERAAAGAHALGDPANLPADAAEQLRGIDEVLAGSADKIKKATEQAAKARTRADAFAQEETADPTLYVTSAKTAIATGKLSVARKELRKAEKLYKARKESDPDLHFTYGELYAKLSLQAKSDDDRRDNLTRAKQSFDRAARSGRGFVATQAKERAAEVQAELDQLGAAPPSP